VADFGFLAAFTTHTAICRSSELLLPRFVRGWTLRLSSCRERNISLSLRERVQESTAVPLSTPKTKLTSTPNSGGLITDKRSALPRTRPAQIAQVPSVPLRTELDLRQQVFKEHLEQCSIVLAGHIC